ncbi:replication-relaxation family protein [Aneurinibacillus aneurinilyticus]|uniref:Uncharacterized protein n=1 Tax=Aneurinibacillus aneurinilyticus ATCC 12856 TaxID=649747 RepID=U1WY93_ANEAE|nr:replication-relaxation family protein [Aneurinibacillus aneurinilyticus]ERI07223.1 hypothetical protein HMPREF0083_04694 [Aneurinibacillus aneurinilyticus ATCC 12856]MED0706844.1 replication-relaxation family protein [Aneurinibacillus aneurinilyticus]MED0725919.1 replication-relaxation family protein [Aneurinibacillus aneurinilyticus]MED0730370.1 replication-relaxation family protein [Aneurinibacillus aneurinilyticus]MED0739199.1 replication-relaxation family protein [Aneurinibacillus aneur
MNSKMEIKKSLYEYEIMTTQQLAILHGWKQKTVYSYLQKMSKDKQIRKVDVPEIKRGAKAYSLMPNQAKYVAEFRNELAMFQPKEWETVPGSMLSILLANQIFCEMIRSTREMPDAGIVEWTGRRTLMQRYQEDEKKPLLKMNSYGVFYYENQKRNIYLDILNGTESLAVLETMLLQHSQLITIDRPKSVGKTLLLFVYLGKSAGRTILQLWRKFSAGSVDIPFVAVAHFEELAEQGIFSSVWQSLDKEGISLMDMPFQVSEKELQESDFLGKTKSIRFQFKSINGFFDEKEATNVKKDEESNKEEDAIEWE